MAITINGTSPLLVNQFHFKSIQEIEDKYRNKVRTGGKKVPISAEQEYENSLYKMPGKKEAYGVPAAGLRLMAVSACRYTDFPMTRALGSFHVIEDDAGLCVINGKPQLDERMVRVGNFGNKKPCLRRRGIFKNWSIKFKVQYRPDIISAEQLLNLYENAGFSVGLCEHRPEKKGSLGMFEVARG